MEDDIKSGFRERLTAILLAVVLAFSMGIALPGMALANEATGSEAAQTTGWITPSAQTVNAVVGQQVNLKDYITSSGTDDGSNAHLDFRVDGTPGIASVNKHSGILTPSAAGSTYITVFLTPGPQPSRNPSNPCYPDTITTATIYVEVSEASDYGFQGLDNAIKMTSPAVLAWSVNADGDFVNALGALTPVNDTLTFTFQQTAGFRNQTIESYASSDFNGDNVVLRSGDGDEERLSAGERLTVTDLDSDNSIVTLQIDTAGLSDGTYELVFTPNFRGNNIDRTLGVSVAFTFTI